MTGDPSAPDQGAAAVASADIPPAVTVLPSRAPRAGEMSPAWRLVTTVSWVAVAVALGSVWKTSDQLGLSTWWIGPRGAPQPLVVQILPFVPSVIVVLAAVNHVRALPWLGLVSAALVIAVGVADLGEVTRLAVVEIAVGAAAAIVSAVSFTGVYRPLQPSGEPVERPAP